MLLAASEQRKTTMRATSTGSPIVLNGLSLVKSASMSASDLPVSRDRLSNSVVMRPVLVGPGFTALTEMPSGPAFVGQALGDGEEGGVGGRARQEARVGLFAGVADDGDDAAVFLLAHRGNDGAHHAHRCEELELRRRRPRPCRGCPRRCRLGRRRRSLPRCRCDRTCPLLVWRWRRAPRGR